MLLLHFTERRSIGDEMLSKVILRTQYLSVALLFFLSGCFSPVSLDKNVWLVGREKQRIAEHFKYDAYAKLTSLTVRSPFDSIKLAVLRGDGTIAFDAYNVFASLPSSMLKSAAVDALNNAALFKGVFLSGSSVKSTYEVEVEVLKFALDCTSSRKAAAEVSVVILNGRTPEHVLLGKSFVDASDGNYSAAFTDAFFAAMRNALSSL